MQVSELYVKYYELIPKNKVKELSRINSRIAIKDTFLCWMFIIVAWTLVYLFPSIWMKIGAVFLVGFKYYGLYIIGHDGMHGRLFKDRKKNDLFSTILLLAPIGAITRINKRNHLTHHRYLSSEHDPDIFKHSCIGKETTIDFLFFLTGFKKIIRAFWHVYLNKDFGDLKRPVTAKAEQHSFFDIFILIAWQLGLCFSLTYFFGWWGYLLLWIMPVYITILMDNIRSFSEHSHPERDEIADEHRLITYLPNGIERFIFAPFNMHHHAAHHLWPGIPYYNLAKATEEMKKHKKAAKLEWRTSYFRHLTNWLLQLPLKNCTPN